jgi:hypothetical protein
MKSTLKKALLAADVAFSAVKIAGIAAKIRKDLHTHKEHPEHNPCECPEHCLGCLF